ncbi:hypothetical protein [Actibacterium sp. MT2.3-13A]|uniref:hypothetical protein n=1 Tax=Actibacterium sp. MT2.3-13A TaxID=2828332 RepID=UPI001BA6980E|nr:hypothetical protein [Actibacterium sp. MT2.3-13A]
MGKNERQEVELLTTNERAWLRFLREVSFGRDPAPTLRRVQLLRRICASRRA